MDVMMRRRQLMAMQTTLDTSPVILQYGVSYKSNGEVTTTADRCVTGLYYYPVLIQTGTIVYFGTGNGNAVVYRHNGTIRVDYWSLAEINSPRRCINTGSDAIKFTLKMSELDNCYAYLQDTGQIFFAGKNSIYYGHRNISELN